jgi:hypothetical protein
MVSVQKIGQNNEYLKGISFGFEEMFEKAMEVAGLQNPVMVFDLGTNLRFFLVLFATSCIKNTTIFTYLTKMVNDRMQSLNDRFVGETLKKMIHTAKSDKFLQLSDL